MAVDDIMRYMVKSTGNGVDKDLKLVPQGEQGRITQREQLRQKQGKALKYYIEEQGHVSNVIRRIGVNRSSWYRWLNNKRFALAVKQADKALDDTVEQVMIGKAKGGSSSELLFYLKRRHERYKDKPMGIGIKGAKIEVVIMDYKSSDGSE